MADFKENVITELLRNKYVQILVLLILISTSVNHFYRCYSNKNSSFLWGFHECQECKIEPEKVVIDTIYKDTCRNRFTPTVSTEPSKILQKAYDFSQAEINGPSQFGDNNTQNNQLGLKPREVSVALIKGIASRVPSRETPIGIGRRSQDTESYEFAAKIVKALYDKGYKNAFVNGIVNDQIVGGDPDEAIKQQREIGYSFADGQLNVTIPSNQ